MPIFARAGSGSTPVTSQPLLSKAVKPVAGPQPTSRMFLFVTQSSSTIAKFV